MATLLEQMYRGVGLSAPYSAKTKDRFARQAGYTPLDTGGADYYSPATNKKLTAYSAAKPKTTSKEKYGNSLSVPASMFDEENKKRNKLNYIVNENYQLTKGWGTSNPYSQLDYINEDERLIVSDYVAQKEYDSAYRYLESISSQLDRRQADSEYKKTVDFAKKYPITATAVSSVNSGFKPIELGVNIAQYIDNKNAGKSTAFDPNSQSFSTSRYSAAVNEGLMADSDNIERILKNAGISLANQQAVRGIVGTGLLNELFMAAQVAQDSLYENSKNNLSGEDALVNSFGKGAIAYWTERFFPSEKLMGVKLSDLQDSLLESIKKSSMSEGFEEVMENVLSNIWDTAQLGDKSEISQLVVAYRERGYSKHSALFRAFMKKYVYDSRESFFTGALSGGVANGVNTVANSIAATGKISKLIDLPLPDSAEIKHQPNGLDKNTKFYETNFPDGKSELTRKKGESHRRTGEGGRRIIDKPTYNKLTQKFVSNGGIIIRGEDAKRHLGENNAASYLSSLNSAFIRDDATISDVLEEMYHAEQDRKNMFGDVLTPIVAIKREIDAQRYLLSVTEKYKIPIEETEITKRNLEIYEKELQKLLKEEK